MKRAKKDPGGYWRALGLEGLRGSKRVPGGFWRVPEGPKESERGCRAQENPRGLSKA